VACNYKKCQKELCYYIFVFQGLIFQQRNVSSNSFISVLTISYTVLYIFVEST